MAWLPSDVMNNNNKLMIILSRATVNVYNASCIVLTACSSVLDIKPCFCFIHCHLSRLGLYIPFLHLVKHRKQNFGEG